MILRAVTIFSIFALCACGVGEAIDSTKKMPERLDKTQVTMEDGIRVQKIGFAMQNMFNADNTKVLKPIPTNMMFWGSIIAEEAHTQELLSLAELWMIEVNEGDLDEAPEGGGDSYTLANNRNKMVKLTGLSIVAGLTPQEKVDEIIQAEILNGGAKEAIAYVFLHSRAKFIHDILMKNKYLVGRGRAITNLGVLNEAFHYMEILEAMDQLPFKNKIRLKTTGFDGEFQPNFDEGMDLKLERFWTQINWAVYTNMDKRTLNSATKRGQLRDIKLKMKPYLKKWKVKNP